MEKRNGPWDHAVFLGGQVATARKQIRPPPGFHLPSLEQQEEKDEEMQIVDLGKMLNSESLGPLSLGINDDVESNPIPCSSSESTSESLLESSITSKSLEVDVEAWTCPSCKNKNFSWRFVCNMRKCRELKPQKFMDCELPKDSWVCHRCGNVNFAHRQRCNMRKCRTPRRSKKNIQDLIDKKTE